jgi:hypothetical protein
MARSSPNRSLVCLTGLFCKFLKLTHLGGLSCLKQIIASGLFILVFVVLCCVALSDLVSDGYAEVPIEFSE